MMIMKIFFTAKSAYILVVPIITRKLLVPDIFGNILRKKIVQKTCKTIGL